MTAPDPAAAGDRRAREHEAGHAVSGDVADGPTLGQAAYEGFVAFQETDGFEYETWADKDEHGDSAVMGRADWEAAGAAAGAAAIARLGQPAELAAAMAENVRLRRELHERDAQLADALTPTAGDFDHAADIMRLRGGCEADIASLTDQRNRISDTADQFREQLGVLQDRIGNLAAGLKLSASSSHPSKKSEIETGVADALLALVDPR